MPDPETKLPNPAKVKAFADANPEVLLQGKHFASQPEPASFAKVNYWGVNAFAFVNASGQKQFVKWVFEPGGGTAGLTDDEAKAKGPNFLADELRQRVAGGVVPLPDDRKKVTVGRLTLKSVSPDSTGSCVTINFNPLVLPKGVEPSSDPLLAARVTPYAVSLGRRLGEGAKQ